MMNEKCNSAPITPFLKEGGTGDRQEAAATSKFHLIFVAKENVSQESEGATVALQQQQQHNLKTNSCG